VGRLSRALAALVLAAGLVPLGADRAAALDGFGAMTADSTYGEEIRFVVELDGAAPDRLQLLVTLPGSDASIVYPVQPKDGQAVFVWDAAADHVTPNTLITYQWRALDGTATILSEVGQLRYEDDRPGLDWQRAQLGEATVHWYGGAEQQALRFGELTAQGVARGEELLGTELAGPVDVFVYATQEDFFGALGPGAREWTGAAAYSELRTIFMWLEGGSTEYLEVAMLHEVTHIVFHDATGNPFHEPARWLNEGVATWAEDGSVDDERSIVELEAGGSGLLSFEAISEQFPIGERAARLSYAQGTMLIDQIVADHGEEALAEIAAAFRDGASDAEALEAGSGMPANELYARFFADYGVDAPQPIAADAIPPSNVDRPVAGSVDEGGVDPSAEPAGEPAGEPPDEAAPGEPDDGSVLAEIGLVLLVVAAVALAVAAALIVSRRAAARTPDP
jgi:hypothetical protein